MPNNINLQDFLELQEDIDKMAQDFYEISGGKITHVNDILTKTELTIYNTLQDYKINIHDAQKLGDDDLVDMLTNQAQGLSFCLQELLRNIIEYGEYLEFNKE